MKNLKYLALTALVAGTFGAANAHAEARHTTSHPMKAEAMTFKSLDKDKNGVLSEAEYDAHPVSSEKFSQIDTNGDGSLTLAELEKAPMAPATKAPAPTKMN